MIRNVILDDLPWMMDLAKRTFDEYDEKDTLAFLSSIIPNKNFLVIRSEKSVIASHIYEWMYNHTIKYSEELFLASEGNSGWQIYYLLKESIKWAKENQSRSYEFGLGEASKTGRSLEVLAKRLGGLISRPNHYKVIF